MSPQKRQVQSVRNITIENAELHFRNFSGNEGRFNAKGRRNFCVFFDAKTADDLARDGWNIKMLKPREDGDAPQAYMQVTVSYKVMPPRIIVVTSKNKTTLEEASINVLDWAEITYVDLVVRPYLWEVNDKSGVKAYVKTMYVTIAEDDLEMKYENVPDAAIANLESEPDEEE